MNQPIRLAMLGGLQRTGLTAHLMGNFRLHNAPPHQALKSTYKFNGESSISVKVPLHIMLPRDKSINELFVIECYSHIFTIPVLQHKNFPSQAPCLQF